MTILVFGRTGQVARELAVHEGVQCLDRSAVDLSDPAACAKVIMAMRPGAVINAAAYTAVDRAEEQEPLAQTINAQAPAAMARACAQLNIPFITFSTDYVFAGRGSEAWSPDEATSPLSAYGRSKVAGEQAVAAVGGIWIVLRTSWVISAHGSNFVKTMLRLGAERDTLTVVADQVGGPTPARDIAAACLKMVAGLRVDRELSGIYHFAGAPDVSWADLARAIFTDANLTCTVKDIPTSAYPTPAVRPLNSRLNCSSLTASFGIIRPDWRQGLADILTDLKGTP